MNWTELKKKKMCSIHCQTPRRLHAGLSAEKQIPQISSFLRIIVVLGSGLKPALHPRPAKGRPKLNVSHGHESSLRSQLFSWLVTTTLARYMHCFTWVLSLPGWAERCPHRLPSSPPSTLGTGQATRGRQTLWPRNKTGPSRDRNQAWSDIVLTMFREKRTVTGKTYVSTHSADWARVMSHHRHWPYNSH